MVPPASAPEKGICVDEAVFPQQGLQPWCLPDTEGHGIALTLYRQVVPQLGGFHLANVIFQIKDQVSIYVAGPCGASDVGDDMDSAVVHVEGHVQV